MAKVQGKNAKLQLASNSDSISEGCFAEQAAFSIDHILESILSNLKMDDLTQTRLLSHRLNYFSCRKIELILAFYLNIGSRHPVEKDLKDRSTVRSSTSRFFESRGTLEDFTLTLSTANRFPCNVFSVKLTYFFLQQWFGYDPRIQSFFALQGSYINTLFLYLIDIPRGMILNQLTYVLIETSPNLHNLTLDVNVESCRHYLNTELSLERPSKEWLLPNLKSLSVVTGTNQIFALLMKAAINLQRYKARNDSFLKYFTTHPGNSRLHLLKDLYISGSSFFPAEKYLNELDSISGLLETRVEFQIRVLHLKLSFEIRERPDVWPRTLFIVNKVLLTVSKTVEEIFLEPIRFLIGIQMPVFPKVHQLVLDEFSARYSVRCIEEYFPTDFIDISNIFPILNFIMVFQLDRCYKDNPPLPFNLTANSAVWKLAVKSYKDFNGISQNKFLCYQVYERTSLISPISH